jgi:hypothetical protein
MGRSAASSFCWTMGQSITILRQGLQHLLTHEAITLQIGHQRLGVVKDVVCRGGLAAKCVHIRIVPVDQDTRPHGAQALREKLHRPKDAVLRRPCVLRMPV